MTPAPNVPPGSEGTHLAPHELAGYFALMETASLLQQAVDQHLRTADLSYIQFQILARLTFAPESDLRMSDLADAIVFSPSGLTYQAGRLEERGLIQRRQSPDDERSTLVEVTAAGRALVLDTMPGHVELVRRLLMDELAPGELTLLSETLGRVRDRLRERP